MQVYTDTDEQAREAERKVRMQASRQTHWQESRQPGR